MSKNQFSLTGSHKIQTGAIELSDEHAKILGFHESDEIKGEIKGLVHQPKAYKALCVSHDYLDPKNIADTRRTAWHFHGVKTLFHIAKTYTMMEGKLWLHGQCIRGFVSRQIFKLSSGKHVEADVIYACKNHKIGDKE
jgi:hypothetical protein